MVNFIEKFESLICLIFGLMSMLGVFLQKPKISQKCKCKEDMKSTKLVGHPVSTKTQENNELINVNLILIVDNCCSLKIP